MLHLLAEHAVSRAVDLCRSFAEWKAAQGGRRNNGEDAALQAALEHGGFGLRLPPPVRRGRLLLHIPVDTRLPRGYAVCACPIYDVSRNHC